MARHFSLSGFDADGRFYQASLPFLAVAGDGSYTQHRSFRSALRTKPVRVLGWNPFYRDGSWLTIRKEGK